MKNHLYSLYQMVLKSLFSYGFMMPAITLLAYLYGYAVGSWLFQEVSNMGVISHPTYFKGSLGL